MYLNAKIFFANDRVYLIDYTVLNQYKGVYFTESGKDALELYPTNVTSPFYGAVADTISLGSEGIDTVINNIIVTYRDEENRSAEYPYDSQLIRLSKSSYGEVGYSINIGGYFRPGHNQEQFARKIAQYVENYRAEPQQSISFKLKERSMVNGEIYWSPFFPIVAGVSGLSSEMDEVKITNKSKIDNNRAKPQRLALSTYIRHYPEGTSEYTFGLANNVDLSQSTSEILTRTG